MTEDAMTALAYHIETLDTQARRWEEAYRKLAANRMAWIDAELRQTHLAPMQRQQIANRFKARLRLSW